MSDCRLKTVLDARFTDWEARDVASYGCISGVPGFTYYSETCLFFDKYQDDIEKWLLDNHEFSLSEICKEIESVDLLKNKMVWLAVDLYCQEIVIYNETFQPA